MSNVTLGLRFKKMFSMFLDRMFSQTTIKLRIIKSVSKLKYSRLGKRNPPSIAPPDGKATRTFFVGGCPDPNSDHSPIGRTWGAKRAKNTLLMALSVPLDWGRHRISCRRASDLGNVSFFLSPRAFLGAGQGARERWRIFRASCDARGFVHLPSRLMEKFGVLWALLICNNNFVKDIFFCKCRDTRKGIRNVLYKYFLLLLLNKTTSYQWF